MSTLIIGKPGAEPIRFPIDDGKVNRIGRDPENDVVVSDPYMSSFHAELSFDANQRTFVVRDIGSSNGTKVAGQTITEPVTLRNGDTLTFGVIEATLVSTVEVQLQERVNGSTTPKKPQVQKITPRSIADKVSKGGGLLNKEIVQQVKASKQRIGSTVNDRYQSLSSGEGNVVLRKAFVTTCCLCYHVVQGCIRSTSKHD